MSLLILQKKTGTGPVVWDTSVPTYSGVSLDVSSQTGTPSGVFVKPDGTEIYVTGRVEKGIHKYTMSTPWNLSSASHTNTYTITTPPFASAHTPYDVFFSSDGMKMYTISAPGEFGINEYNLSVAWDQTSGTFVTTYAPTGEPAGLHEGLFISGDGTKLYTVGWSGIDEFVCQHTLSTPWSMATASYDSVKLDMGAIDTRITDVHFSEDGDKMWVSGTSNGSGSGSYLYQFSLSTDWDLSTATFDGIGASLNVFSLLSSESSVAGMHFRTPGGDRVYVCGNANNRIYQVDLA